MAEGKTTKKRSKRMILTIEDKIDMCNRLENGENRRKLMQDYGISSSTVYEIRKRKDKLLKFHSTCEYTKASKQRKVLRKPKLEQLDTILYEWFVVNRSNGSIITGPILKEKAKEFYEKMDLSEKCSFSDGWLARFKCRHGIRKLELSSEQKLSNSKAAKKYVDTFAKLVEENSLSPEQIYNADETGLLWRYLPDKIFAGNDEEVNAGFKSNKDRLTVLCCANASGTHRIKLLVIGRHEHSRAFKNVRQLPVEYVTQSNAWMSQDIFKNWFFNIFVPSVKQHFISVGLSENSKCVLLLDNSSAHSSELELRMGNIFVKYLPVNAIALIQPMDQGVVQSMKCFYRRDFLRKIVNYEGTVRSFQNTFNIKDAIFNIACAWSLVKKETLHCAWKKLWRSVILNKTAPGVDTDVINNQDDYCEEITEMVSSLGKVLSLNSKYKITAAEVDEWLKCDEEAAIAYTITDDDLIDSLLNSESENTSKVSVDEEAINKSVSWTAADKAFNTFIKFAESNQRYSAQETVHLHTLYSNFLQKRQTENQ